MGGFNGRLSGGGFLKFADELFPEIQSNSYSIKVNRKLKRDILPLREFQL